MKWVPGIRVPRGEPSPLPLVTTGHRPHMWGTDLDPHPA